MADWSEYVRLTNSFDAALLRTYTRKVGPHLELPDGSQSDLFSAMVGSSCTKLLYLVIPLLQVAWMDDERQPC